MTSDRRLTLTLSHMKSTIADLYNIMMRLLLKGLKLHRGAFH